MRFPTIALLALTAGVAQATEDWVPTEAQLKALGPEHAGKGWSIRPPAGARHKFTDDLRELRNTWAIGDNKNQALASLTVTTTKLQRNVGNEEALNAIIEMQKQRIKGLVAGPVETGTIDGKAFARVRFAAESAPIPGFEQGPIYGFFYTTEAGIGPILFGMGKADQMEMLEAAAHTIKITP